MNQTPANGLKIIESLYMKHPFNQQIRNSLINAYIRLGKHKESLEMIANTPESKKSTQSLQLKAWACYQNNDLRQEQEIWQEIIQKTPKTEFIDKSDELLYRSQKLITIEKSDVLLFCAERDEILRLPFFLEHYRSLGVTKFFFIDNNSQDGSFELLQEQKDCYVFWTNHNYSEAGSSVSWVQCLIDKYALDGQWCLFADADEFLIYPNYETKKIPVLIDYLDEYNFEIMTSYMLDMFPQNIKKQLEIKSGDNLFKYSPYFYNNYQFQHQIECPYIRPVGGIFDSFGMPLLRLTKISLFKKSKKFRFLSAAHASTPLKIANVSSAFLHFKMLGNFKQAALKEVKRKQHCGGGIQYRKFANLYTEIQSDFDFSKLDKTVKYQSSQQLVDLGLIQCSQEWTDFVSKEKINDD